MVDSLKRSLRSCSHIAFVILHQSGSPLFAVHNRQELTTSQLRVARCLPSSGIMTVHARKILDLHLRCPCRVCVLDVRQLPFVGHPCGCRLRARNFGARVCLLQLASSSLQDMALLHYRHELKLFSLLPCSLACYVLKSCGQPHARLDIFHVAQGHLRNQCFMLSCQMLESLC